MSEELVGRNIRWGARGLNPTDGIVAPCRIRLLHGKDVSLEYKPRSASEKRFAVSHGARRYFNTFLDILNIAVSENITHPIVVYSGSAPGCNIAFISKHFYPDFEYHLYDTKRFAIEPTSNIHLYKTQFSDEIAAEWSKRVLDGEHILFVSDCKSETCDNVDDVRWIRMMRPQLSMLRFHPPWINDIVKYIPGEIRFQPFASPSSTETRLIVREKDIDAELVQIDCKIYADELYAFNNLDRKYNHRNYPHVKITGPRYEWIREFQNLYTYWRLQMRGTSHDNATDIAKAASDSMLITEHEFRAPWSIEEDHGKHSNKPVERLKAICRPNEPPNYWQTVHNKHNTKLWKLQ